MEFKQSVIDRFDEKWLENRMLGVAACSEQLWLRRNESRL